MDNLILLLIPAAALFFWYWGFWRNLDKDKSQSQESTGQMGSNFIDQGFEVKSSGSKRYIQQSKPKTVKKRSVKKRPALRAASKKRRAKSK
ncbi:MAG: hypothetical protein ACKOPV_04120 [Candidatus Nanopelagicus sp.]